MRQAAGSSSGTAVALVAIAWLLGCSVDDRTLSVGHTSDVSASGGSGGSPASGLPTGGQGDVTPEPVELPICVYDGSVEPECDTLVANAGFVSDTTAWSAEDGSYGNWDKANASGAPTTGSITVLNMLHGKADGVAPGAARQCLPAVANAFYDFAADVLIPADQGEGIHGEMYVGEARLSAFFSAETDCSGPTISNFDSVGTAEVGTWMHVAGSGRAPKAARSVIVRLNTLKAMRQFAFQAHFDNVFVRAR